MACVITLSFRVNGGQAKCEIFFTPIVCSSRESRLGLWYEVKALSPSVITVLSLLSSLCDLLIDVTTACKFLELFTAYPSISLTTVGWIHAISTPHIVTLPPGPVPTMFPSTIGYNISLYTVPAAWIICLAPHVYAALLYQVSSKRNFDNKFPRHLSKNAAECQNVDSATKDRIIRAEMAQANGLESIGVFAAAVVAANMTKVDQDWLNGLSVGYVVSRILYNVIYVNNTTDLRAWTRSVVWVAGVGMVMALYVLSGNQLVQ